MRQDLGHKTKYGCSLTPLQIQVITMTNDEKALLRKLAKEGKTLEQIQEYLDCCDATIRKYIKIFRPKDQKE